MARFFTLAALLTLSAICGCSEAGQPSPVVTTQISSLPRDLAELIDAGLVNVVSANGKGSSSGAAIDGVIRNESTENLKIDIVMSRAVFFQNGGSGQNMIASMILGEGGKYSAEGEHSFLSLKPSEQVRVTFIAYCADFDKENPTSSEVFTIATAPPNLMGVMRRISAYSRAHPDEDVTAAAQVAVWLAQGISADTTREKFSFSPGDEALARTLAQ